MASEQHEQQQELHQAQLESFRLEVDVIFQQALMSVATAAEKRGLSNTTVSRVLDSRLGEDIADAWDELALEIAEDEEDRG